MMQGVAYPTPPRCALGGVLPMYHVDSLWVEGGPHVCVAHDLSKVLYWQEYVSNSVMQGVAYPHAPSLWDGGVL